MNFNEFQEHAKGTQPPEGNDDDITNYALGLIGEAAEVSELIKKWRFHGHDLNKEKIAEELGDVLHYLAGLSTMIGYSMEVVAEMNVDKLLDRYPDGFREEASKNRKDKNDDAPFCDTRAYKILCKQEDEFLDRMVGTINKTDMQDIPARKESDQQDLSYSVEHENIIIGVDLSDKSDYTAFVVNADYSYEQLMKEYNAYVEDLKNCGYECQVMRLEDFYIKSLTEKGLIKKALKKMQGR